jgi:formyltetrahydrofolate deformylase
MYFQRIRFDLSELVVGAGNTAVLERAVAEVADRFGMEWSLFYDKHVKRVAILVSRMDHCLYDILIRHRAGMPWAVHRPLFLRLPWCCWLVKTCVGHAECSSCCAAGELKCEIPIIISNHPDLEGVAASFGIPFRCLPLPAGSGPEGKRAQVPSPFAVT